MIDFVCWWAFCLLAGVLSLGGCFVSLLSFCFSLWLSSVFVSVFCLCSLLLSCRCFVLLCGHFVSLWSFCNLEIMKN